MHLEFPMTTQNKTNKMYTWIFNIRSEDTLYKHLKAFLHPRRAEGGLRAFTSGVIADIE